MPYTTLVAGTTITASWANASVRDQVVTPFASSAARTSAVSTPVRGMLSVLTNTDTFEAYTTSWRSMCSAGAYQSYTPAWTSTGSAPSLGNGTITGQYRYAAGLIIAELRLVMGSTTTFGTGVYLFSLPVTGSANAANFSGGSWHALDTGTQEYGGATKLETTTTIRAVMSAGGSVGQTSPFTWASTDAFRAQVIYEPA